MTIDHTPRSVHAASGTVTANVTTGWIACSDRWRAKSMRRKNTHSGASSAKASGSHATPSVSPSSRGWP